MEYVKYLAALIVGLLWGWIHSVLWLQMNIPILFEIANAVKSKPGAVMPKKAIPGAMKKFLASLFGTGVSGGVFALLQGSEISLSLYVIGLFFGFAPTILITLWKYILIILSGYFAAMFIPRFIMEDMGAKFIGEFTRIFR